MYQPVFYLADPILPGFLPERRHNCQMRILFHCPMPRDSTRGNAVSAQRISAILGELGHSVLFSDAGSDWEFDVVIAQHAIRSRKWLKANALGKPTVVIISGTELLAEPDELGESLSECTFAATTCEAIKYALPVEVQPRTRVIRKSIVLPDCVAARKRAAPQSQVVSVVGHIRKVKRSLLAATASRILPGSSTIKIELIGDVIDDSYHKRIQIEKQTNLRFRWLGELSRIATLQSLANSLGTVNSSIVEGGANSIGEAILLDVPVLATRIPGNTGLLGESHCGLFEVDNHQALSDLMLRLENESAFRDAILKQQQPQKLLFDVELEKQGWRDLLAELPVS